MSVLHLYCSRDGESCSGDIVTVHSLCLSPEAYNCYCTHPQLVPQAPVSPLQCALHLVIQLILPNACAPRSLLVVTYSVISTLPTYAIGYYLPLFTLVLA